jgi:hypothetical protein
MSNTTTTASGGIGFAGLLTIAFIILKLCGVITWKWVWVLSPIWISIPLYLVFLAFYFVVLWLITKFWR